MTKHKKRWLVILTVLAFLVGIPLTLRCYQSHQVSVQLSSIQASGDPITFADIIELNEQPPHDATNLWVEAFTLLQAIGGEDMEALEKLPYVGYADDPSEGSWAHIELAEAYIGKRSRAIELLHNAAKLYGHARFPVDAQGGFASLLHPNGLLDAHKLLQLETHLYAFQNDSRRAFDGVRTRLALALSLENSPASSSQRLRWSIDAIALRDFSKFIAVLPVGDESLLEMQAMLRHTRYDKGFTLQCLALRAEGINMFQDPVAAKDYINTYNAMLSLPQVQVQKELFKLQEIRAHEKILWWFDKPQDFLTFLEMTGEIVGASKCSWPQAFDRSSRIGKNLNSKVKSGALGIRHLLTSMLVKSPEKSFARWGRAIARNCVYDAAISVEMYRRRNGELPPTLDSLVPEFLPNVPIDPFSGEQVRFVSGAQNFVVYSVGSDRVDNSGDGSQFGHEPDVTCRLHIPD